MSDCKVEEAVVKYCVGMQETENKEKQAEKSESIGRHQGEQVEDEDTVRGIQDKNHFLSIANPRKQLIWGNNQKTCNN